MARARLSSDVFGAVLLLCMAVGAYCTGGGNESSAAGAGAGAAAAAAALMNDRSLNATAALGNGTALKVNNGTAVPKRLDVVTTALGYTIGPLVLVYGNDLQAIVVMLNALYACGLQRMLDALSSIKGVASLRPDLPIQIYSTVIAATTMTSVSLKGGMADLMLKVGIISNMMQSTAVKMMAQFQDRLPPAAVGTVNSAVSSVIAFASTLLATSPIPAGISATIVALNNGVITPAVAGLSKGIKAKELDCEPADPSDTPTDCITARWLSFLVMYIPVVVPVATALFVRRARDKAKALKDEVRAKARAMKDSAAAAQAAAAAAGGLDEGAVMHRPGRAVSVGDGPEKLKTSPLIKVNSAVMAANLLMNAVFLSWGPLLREKGLLTETAKTAMMWLLVGASIVVQVQLERRSIEGLEDSVHPRCTKLVDLLFVGRSTCLRPIIALNNAIIKVAGGKMPPGAAAAGAAAAGGGTGGGGVVQEGATVAQNPMTAASPASLSLASKAKAKPSPKGMPRVRSFASPAQAIRRVLSRTNNAVLVKVRRPEPEKLGVML